MLRMSLATEQSSSQNPDNQNRVSEQALKSDDSLLSTPITRRDFLKGGLGLTGAILASTMPNPDALANLTFPGHRTPVINEARLPVSIIGGGLAGLVTAYRLSRQGIRCELYEAGYRLGGRVLTRSHFNTDGMFVEMGGELVDTGHQDLISLCQELRVPLEHFDFGESGIEPAIFYSQGTVYTEAQVLEAFQGLAQVLITDLKRCFPDGELAVPTVQNPGEAKWLDNLSLADYLDKQKTVVPTWLLRLIRSAYIGEYGLEPEEQSALNLVLLIGTDTKEGFRLFGESDESMRVHGGNSRLVEALIHAIEANVPIHYGHQLSHLALSHTHAAPNVSQGNNVTRQNKLKLGFTVDRRFRWVPASHVVLALPFSLLREVKGLSRLGLSPLKLQCIQEWSYGTNSKQMIGFHSRFWRMNHSGVKANSGELITDLPSQCYWDTSRLQTGNSGILTNFTGGKSGRAANNHQWQNVLDELKPLYGDLSGQRDGNLAFMNWSRNPWSKGSYTCPRPGQYTTLMGVAQLPELDGCLLFAGEHCSINSAGYMNGAVESGNTVARQISEKFAQATVPTKTATMVAPL